MSQNGKSVRSRADPPGLSLTVGGGGLTVCFLPARWAPMARAGIRVRRHLLGPVAASFIGVFPQTDAVKLPEGVRVDETASHPRLVPGKPDQLERGLGDSH